MNLPKTAKAGQVVTNHEPSTKSQLRKPGDGPIPVVTRDNRIPHNLPPELGHKTGVARPPAKGGKG